MGNCGFKTSAEPLATRRQLASNHLEAVTRDGRELEFVPDDLRTEKLCFAAVRQCANALQHVPEAQPSLLCFVSPACPSFQFLCSVALRTISHWMETGFMVPVCARSRWPSDVCRPLAGLLFATHTWMATCLPFLDSSECNKLDFFHGTTSHDWPLSRLPSKSTVAYTSI